MSLPASLAGQVVPEDSPPSVSELALSSPIWPSCVECGAQPSHQHQLAFSLIGSFSLSLELTSLRLEFREIACFLHLLKVLEGFFCLL